MIRQNNYSAAVCQQLRSTRRGLASASPEMFTEIYLQSQCHLPFSRMHREVYAELVQMMRTRSSRLAIAAPRGHAKSTIVSLACVLWCALYEKENLILIVSATKEQAILLLKAIKDELQSNLLLQEDFPEICVTEGMARKPKPWRDHRIQLPNGVMICGYGCGQSLRGIKKGKNRPGLIVVDDIEDREQVVSEEQRQKLEKWFRGDLLKAGHPDTNVVMVGTVLHHDSLLARLIDPDKGLGWTGLKYQAIESPSDYPNLWEAWTSIYRSLEVFEDQYGPDAARAFYEENKTLMNQGTRVLWEELEDYYALMVMQEREGQASFQAEKQNEPLDPEQCIFSEERFVYWDTEFPTEEDLFRHLGRNGYFFGACDPSLGQRTGRGDYSAIVILYQDRATRVNYVLVADIARRSPDETIKRIIHYTGKYPFTHFGVESNHFQQLMVNNLIRHIRKLGLHNRIKTITSRSNKQSRIANLEPEISQGQIRFCKKHNLLLDQLRQFPLGKHDDGPDALEMAMQMANRPRGGLKIRPLFC